MNDERPPGPPAPPRVPGHLGVPSRDVSLDFAAIIGALATIEACRLDTAERASMNLTKTTRLALQRAERAGLKVRWFTKPACELWVCRDHGVVLSRDEPCRYGAHDDDY